MPVPIQGPPGKCTGVRPVTGLIIGASAPVPAVERSRWMWPADPRMTARGVARHHRGELLWGSLLAQAVADERLFLLARSTLRSSHHSCVTCAIIQSATGQWGQDATDNQGTTRLPWALGCGTPHARGPQTTLCRATGRG